MLGKLLSLMVAGKGGAAAAAAIVAGATTVGVMTTSPEVQDTVGAVTQAVSQVVSPGMSELAKLGKIHGECEKGQPVVVAQRNAADKLLRDAFQDEHKRLVGVRSGKDIDHQKANELLQKAERDLRGVLTNALNDVARETLGREGQLMDKEKDKDDEDAPKSSASPAPSTSPAPTPSATAAVVTTPSPTPAAASVSPTPKPSCSPKPSASPAATTSVLTAKLQGIVDKAKVQMKAIVDTAAAEVAKLPAAERGKSDEKGKPEDEKDKGKPEEKGKSEEKRDAERGKPSERPSSKPSASPARP